MGQNLWRRRSVTMDETLGIDIDSRDTTELIETAKAVTANEIAEIYGK